MSEMRVRIETTIRRRPGIHFSGLVRALDSAPGQVQYHVRRLLGDEAVVAEELYGKTHYYPPEYDGWERRAIALLRRETAGDVVACLLADGPSRPAAVAAELDIAKSTLSWHLDRLEAQGLVCKQAEGTSGVRLVLERPVATARILRDVEPSLRERLVGRFTRLVDNLLEGG